MISTKGGKLPGFEPRHDRKRTQDPFSSYLYEWGQHVQSDELVGEFTVLYSIYCKQEYQMAWHHQHQQHPGSFRINAWKKWKTLQWRHNEHDGVSNHLTHQPPLPINIIIIMIIIILVIVVVIVIAIIISITTITTNAGLILGVRPANERRRYFVTTSLIGGAQA